MAPSSPCNVARTGRFLHLTTVIAFAQMFVYHARMRSVRRLSGICLLATAVGCASWFGQEIQPEVLLTNITPLESTAFEHRLKVELRIRNPDDQDLQITGIDVRLELNERSLARGLGNQPVTVPRLSEAAVSVEASASTLDVVRQVLDLHRKQELKYGISGVLYLASGARPFSNTGVLIAQDDLPRPFNP